MSFFQGKKRKDNSWQLYACISHIQFPKNICAINAIREHDIPAGQDNVYFILIAFEHKQSNTIIFFQL